MGFKMTYSRKKITLLKLIIFFALFLSFSCVHIELPHRGSIKDAETQKPLQNAISVIKLEYGCLLPPSPHGRSEHLDAIEAITGNDGKYQTPFRIYLLPPLLCLTIKQFTYARIGYFTQFEDSNPNQVFLYQMKHYLNYLPYSRSDSFIDGHLDEESVLFKEELEKSKSLSLEPIDEKGVFFRQPGRSFNHIHSRTGYPNNSNYMYYVFDDVLKEWITIDRRGKNLKPKASSMPKWDFMNSFEWSGYPLYATKDSIFYPLDENPIYGQHHKRGDIQYIPAQKGGISALAGNSDSFFTIEDHEALLCHYGRYYVEQKYYPGKVIQDRLVPYFLNCLTGSDLPSSHEDNTFKDSIFRYVVTTLNHGLFVVTRSPKLWHVYNIGNYDEEAKKGNLTIKEFFSFPGEKEITAFTATGNDFYVAFKKEGIKKYSIIPFGIAGKTPQVKEDTIFFMNSRKASYAEVTSMVVGSAINLNALYVTTGEDKIYRFSLDGVPDYIIKPSIDD